MGNSEVGHLNIGAGRIVHMDITRIDLMIQNGELFSHPVLLDAMKHARSGERRLHLFGLLSDGGVHSQQAHLYALLKMAKQNGLDRVFVHAFMDGRDTLPTNGAGYLEQLQQKMREFNCGKIATVNGRYYAMDRDRRWERIAKAYNAMVFADAEGGKCADPVQGMKDSYNKGVTDEFVIPFVCTDSRGQALATIRDEDSCICFNFRADRVRQITRALARNSGLNDKGGSDLPGAADLDATIPRDRVPKNLKYVCMTQYDKNFSLPVVIPPESMANILANVMGGMNMRNLRVAETEKYAHVTYFFNGGVEQPFPGEERVHGAVAQGRDLRSEAGDERGGYCRRCREGDRGWHVRCDDREFRQRRHGGALRQDRADGESCRDGGRLSGTHRGRRPRQGRSHAYHSRSRQCGD